MHVSLSVIKHHDVATLHCATLTSVVPCAPRNSSRIKYHPAEFCTCVSTKEAIESNDELGSAAFPTRTRNLIFTLFEHVGEMRQTKQLCLSCDNQRE
jgi:phosphoribosyl-AMP cyclohydrolase